MSVVLIENLRDLDADIKAMSVKSGVPATDKLVIVQVLSDDNRVQTIGARYREGRWYGEGGEEDLTTEISNSTTAIWTESILFTETSIHRHVNTK